MVVQTEVFKKNRFIFTLIGLCEYDKEVKWQEKVWSVLACAMVYGINSFSLFTSITFAIRNMSVDLENTLYAIFQSSAILTVWYIMTESFFYRSEMAATFAKYHEFYAKNRHKASFKYFLAASEISHNLITLFMETLFTAYLFASVGQDLINISYCYWQGRMHDHECFYIPYKLIVPWDQTELSGYFKSAAICLLCGPAFFIINFSFLPFFMGIGAHYPQFRYFFRDLIAEIERLARNGPDQLTKIKDTLKEAVTFHNDVKDIFTMTATLFRGHLFILIFGNIIHMACCVFETDLAIHDFQLNFIITFMGVFISGGTLYLYCESAQLATDNLIQFGDEVFDSDWYKLPIEIQKTYILIIANAELPINYDGLHMVYLNSPTFARVLKSVMSYYLMFKTLTG